MAIFTTEISIYNHLSYVDVESLLPGVVEPGQGLLTLAIAANHLGKVESLCKCLRSRNRMAWQWSWMATRQGIHKLFLKSIKMPLPRIWIFAAASEKLPHLNICEVFVQGCLAISGKWYSSTKKTVTDLLHHHFKFNWLSGYFAFELIPIVMFQHFNIHSSLLERFNSLEMAGICSSLFVNWLEFVWRA